MTPHPEGERRMETIRHAAVTASGLVALIAICATLLSTGCAGSAGSATGGSPGDTARLEPAGGAADRALPQFPPGKFTVQLGAYQSEEGAAGVAALSRSRFTKEVYTVFNSLDGLYKVMLGMFDSKDAARNFRDTIVRQYPDDYRDAWVSELTR